MKIFSEFRKFAMRGNVIDLAVGVVIGGAFGKIVSSFVSDILMPPIGLLMGGTDISGLKIILKDKIVENEKVISQAVTLNYGNFIQATVDFLIIAFFIFMFVKLLNSIHSKEKPAPLAPPEPSKEVQLLTEIRDLLKNEQGRN